MNKAVQLRNLDYVAAGEKRRSLSAFVIDTQTKNQIEECLGRMKFGNLEIHQGDIKTAIQKYEKKLSPDLLIVDISTSELPLTDVQKLANVCSPDIRVIVIGNRDNIGLYRNLLNYGVSEYLVKPVPADILYRAITNMQLPIGGTVPSPLIGKAIGIFGACGGVGCSTILNCLGDILANEMHRKTVLVDLNLQQGDLGLQLGQHTQKGLSDLLTSPKRIDELFIERSILKISSRLDLLSADVEWDEDIQTPPKAVGDLTEILRNQYHFVLCDIMKGPLNHALEILASMQVRIVVISPSLPALRNAKKILTHLNRERSDAQTIVVLNNTRTPIKCELDLSKIEEFLERPVDFSIPYDGKNFTLAALSAIPVTRMKRKAVSQIRKAAWKLVGQETQEKSYSLWKRLILRKSNVR